ADVEEAAAEREGDRESRQDQGRHDEKRLLEIERRRRSRPSLHPREEPVEAAAVEDRFVGRERIVAGRDDHEAADEESEGCGRDRERDSRDALDETRAPCTQLFGSGSLGHGAVTASRRPPVIATPSSSSDASGPYSPTISPS